MEFEKAAIGWLQLIFDNWLGNNHNEATVPRPEWPQIKVAINALDGDSRTCLTLCAENDGPEIVMGGGPEKFVVSVAFSDEEIYTLEDGAKPKHEVPLTIGGHTGVYTEQETWGRPVAIEAARYFYAHGKTHPALLWMKVGEGG